MSDKEAIDDIQYESEDDPRFILAEKLRGFFMQAIEQQRLIDAKDSKKRQSGALYKTDGDYIKILLTAPAIDKIFYGSRAGHLYEPELLPDLWAFIALPPETESELHFTFEDVILAADNIILHSVVPGFEPVDIWVRDDYVGAVDTTETAESLLGTLSEEMATSIETEQMVMATHWAELLEKYDLRTIVANTEPDADVA